MQNVVGNALDGPSSWQLSKRVWGITSPPPVPPVQPAGLSSFLDLHNGIHQPVGNPQSRDELWTGIPTAEATPVKLEIDKPLARTRRVGRRERYPLLVKKEKKRGILSRSGSFIVLPSSPRAQRDYRHGIVDETQATTTTTTTFSSYEPNRRPPLRAVNDYRSCKTPFFPSTPCLPFPYTSDRERWNNEFPSPRSGIMLASPLSEQFEEMDREDEVLSEGR